MHYSLYHSWGIDSRLYIYQTYTSIRVLNITSLNCWGKLYLKTAVNELWVMHALLRRVLNERFCKHLLNNSYQYSVLFSCDQAALWMVQSVRLSVCLSVRHTFLAMFPSSYHQEMFRSYHQWQKRCPCKRSRSEVKGQCHRGQHPT